MLCCVFLTCLGKYPRGSVVVGVIAVRTKDDGNQMVHLQVRCASIDVLRFDFRAPVPPPPPPVLFCPCFQSRSWVDCCAPFRVV